MDEVEFRLADRSSAGAWAEVLGGRHRSRWTVWVLSPLLSYSPARPLVRECSGALGAARARGYAAWVRFSSLGSGAILYLFSLLLLSLSSRLFSNITSPHLSATPSQSTRLTKQGKYLAKATLRFSLRDNVSSLLFNLRPCLHILSDYGLALVEVIQSLYLNSNYIFSEL